MTATSATACAFPSPIRRSFPPNGTIDFVDSNGSPFPRESEYRAAVGTIPSGRSTVVGVRLQSTGEGFRRFAGRQLAFAVEAASIFFDESSDRVEDVLVKSSIPIVSIEQSIREPTALVGDVLSFIATVENVTEETALDSVVVTEALSPGLAFAGGSLVPRIAGNDLTWRLERLEPGERREIVFRARVKAGQETGKLVSSARVSGVTDTGERAADGPATASVLIVEGIFTRRGIISGAVFADADSNGSWDEGERGVRGASVFIEDGTYAVTDSFGLYSIPGVVEGRHVVRIDPASLPDSLEPGESGYFGFGEAGEMLVDLAPSGHRRVDFALVRSGRAGVGKGASPLASGRSAPARAEGAADSSASPGRAAAGFRRAGRRGETGSVVRRDHHTEHAFRRGGGRDRGHSPEPRRRPVALDQGSPGLEDLHRGAHGQHSHRERVLPVEPRAFDRPRALRVPDSPHERHSRGSRGLHGLRLARAGRVERHRGRARAQSPRRDPRRAAGRLRRGRPGPPRNPEPSRSGRNTRWPTPREYAPASSSRRRERSSSRAGRSTSRSFLPSAPTPSST